MAMDRKTWQLKKFKNCIMYCSKDNLHAYIWHSSGKLYVGDVSPQGSPFTKEGQGLELIPNSSLYRGEFKESKKHGFGILTLSNGCVYKGQWSNGDREG